MSERKRVLIISAEVDLAMLMRTYYTRRNCEVYIAPTYGNGLSLAIERQPEMIFLDKELCDDFEEASDMLRKMVPHAKVIPPESGLL
jgi:DNA-binding response OmpR family regulator